MSDKERQQVSPIKDNKIEVDVNKKEDKRDKTKTQVGDSQIYIKK